jgi:hypothetical protein
MKFNLQEINKYSVASDTDSTFLTLEPILKKLYPTLDLNQKDEVLPLIRPLQKEIGDKLNLYQSIIAKKICNCDIHRFDLKPEYIVQKAYWSGKRRYAMYMVDREGNNIEKVSMMGLDIMKSNFPPLFRDFGKQLLQNILFSVPKEEIDSSVMEFKESLNNVEWRQLLKPTGVKKIGDYIQSKPQEGEIFSILKKRCPINTRGAIIYNDFIRFRKLNVKYPEFRIGDKMFLAYLKDNPLKLDVIGLNGYDDPPEIVKMVEQYIDREGIFNSVFKNKLENVYKDINWDLNMNIHRNEFFDFG